MSVHGPLDDVVDHWARTWLAPLAELDSDQVLPPAVRVEIWAAIASVSVPSLVIVLDCAVSQVLSGWVPNANVLVLDATLSTLPIWKSPPVAWLVICVV